MAGETQAQIAADPQMPSPSTVWSWTKKHPKFARLYAKAKVLGERDGFGASRSYCEVTATEIAARVSEGESLAAIAREPGMPSLSTIFRWARQEPGFAENLSVAKMAMAERFAEMGWTLAMEATPETAYLTQVRLKQLRWTCAILSPTTYGRLKAADPPAPPEVLNVTHRSFQIEVEPQTGRVRAVALHYDPETHAVVRDLVGPWQDPAYPLLKTVDYVTAATAQGVGGPAAVADQRRWDWRPSSYNPDGTIKPQAERYGGEGP